MTEVNVTLNGMVVDHIPELLTKQEVQKILNRASIAVVDGKPYAYRLGQAIYNELPSYMAYHINGSDQDMFHIKDDELAVTMLLNLAEPM